MRLLILEDDLDIRAPLARFLREAGFAVDEASRADEALSLCEAYPHSAVIADIRLPCGDDAGFAFVRSLRAKNITVPVLMLSARDGLDDRLEGLERAGADDYLTKPFHVREVLARVRALLRRGESGVRLEVTWQDVEMNWTLKRITKAGEAVHLTAKELGVLELLSTHPGRLFSREDIIDRVWEEAYGVNENIIDVYVRNIRRKLGQDILETLRGGGYRFPSNRAA